MAHALTILFVVGIATFIGSLIAVPWILVRIPSDYFVRESREPTVLEGVPPLLRAPLIVAKNLLGGVLIAGGLAMLVLPGQGILTILLGVSLIDFPGKFALERKLVRQEAVHGAINWIRRRRGRAAIEVPAQDGPDAGDGDDGA
jgi:hypothetical protein